MNSQDNGSDKDNIYSAPSADLHVLDDTPTVRIERVITHPFSLENLHGSLPVAWFLVLPFVFYAFALSALVYIFSIM